MKKNNLIRKAKQATAGLLTAAMALTGAPLGSLTSQAAGILPNNDLKVGQNNKYVSTDGNFVYGSSDSTAFVFGPSSGHTGTNSTSSGNTPPTSAGGDKYTFNFTGIESAEYRDNVSRGYYSNDVVDDNANNNIHSPDAQPTIKSAFSDNWWHGYYAFGKPYRVGTDVQNKSGGSPHNPTNPLDPIINS